ncbi:MAG TPA: DPP IV N-terminal domain-containing protein [Gemmatimonadaceae bacterium]|nr:DPP IV N-terminal domain-containing protein [Gemmatimonadaceae bacterium]
MRSFRALALCALVVAPLGLVAQSPAPYRRDSLTADDYRRAEQFMGYNANPLVLGGAVRPNWLPDDRFWYRNAIAEGFEFVLVDPARRSRGRAFDHARLATALGALAGTSYEAFRLPFTTFSFSPDGRSILFQAGQRRYGCDVQSYRCENRTPAGRDTLRNAAVSPDGKRAAFIRDWNLWLRDLETGRETQLTTDGVEHFSYALDNAGWTKSDRTIVLWSPDSRRIATYQQDERLVGNMYLTDTRVGRPNLSAWKYPLPGDSVIQMIHRVVIHVDGPSPRVVRLRMPPDAHRSTTCDHIVCGGRWTDVEWSADGSRLVFVSSSRDHQHAWVREADVETGAVREILHEAVDTFFESGFDSPNWRPLFASNELLWYSQRDDWGHLSLHDLSTGQLKRQVTSGSWNVLEIERLDERARTIVFTALGREAGRDPYFRHLYRAGLDGSNVTLLTPEDADHQISLSPSGRYFVDAYARPDAPPVSVLRDANGRVVLPLEKADITRLVAMGWTAPIPFTVKARDGVTDLYGLMHRPSHFDSTKKYPIVNYIYPGPQSGSVGSRQFVAVRGDTRAIAELGFIVVQIDATGTPYRSKSFHAAWYGNMGDNGLPDQVSGMQQLARRHPWIDLDRAGIYGHSGGGYASTDAILRYPDFFKVAVSQAGNHDNRNYDDDWGEKWQGLLESRPDGSSNYDNQANQLLAQNLKGKLLIAHGTMDANVPPYGTLLVVNELIRHNKDFDLLMLPNRGHGFGSEPYMVRRRWDYFVRHLLGAAPPMGYELRPPGAPIVP